MTTEAALAGRADGAEVTVAWTEVEPMDTAATGVVLDGPTTLTLAALTATAAGAGAGAGAGAAPTEVAGGALAGAMLEGVELTAALATLPFMLKARSVVAMLLIEELTMPPPMPPPPMPPPCCSCSKPSKSCADGSPSAPGIAGSTLPVDSPQKPMSGS